MWQIHKYICHIPGVPDCAHASTLLSSGQQHDDVTPVLGWNVPLLGLVPSQSQREDSERPFGVHGCLSPLCEHSELHQLHQFQLHSIRLCLTLISKDVFPHSLSCPRCRHKQGCVLQTLCRRGLLSPARKASPQSA